MNNENIKAGEIKKDLLSSEANNTVQSAEAEESMGTADNLGKFKDVKSLLNAYNALQSEFTRRCQRVKELERENLQISKEQLNNSLSNEREREIEAFLETFPNAKDELMSLLETAKGSGDSKGWLGRAYLGKLNREYEDKLNYLSSNEYIVSAVNGSDEIKNQIIKDYLLSIENSKPTIRLISGNGMATVSPPSKPKNIADAGMIARQIFEKSKENINL